MLVFAKVVETGSFAKAADTLGLARPSVTVTIRNLESYLNAQLIRRSTRQLNVTAGGEAFYQHCTRVLTDVAKFEDEFRAECDTPRGKLRIEMPAYVAKNFLAPRLAEFQDRYPEIELILSVGELSATIAQNVADCTLRLGPLPDSSLLARPLGSLPLVTVASERYLRGHGIPISVRSFGSHVGIRQFTAGSNRYCEISFGAGTDSVSVRLGSQLAVTDAEVALAYAANGLGIVQSFQFLAQPYRSSGQLLELFPECRPDPTTLFAVFPNVTGAVTAVAAAAMFALRIKGLQGRCDGNNSYQRNP